MIDVSVSVGHIATIVPNEYTPRGVLFRNWGERGWLCVFLRFPGDFDVCS